MLCGKTIVVFNFVFSLFRTTETAAPNASTVSYPSSHSSTAAEISGDSRGIFSTFYFSGMQACPAVKLHKDPLSPFHLVEVNLSLHTHRGGGREGKESWRDSLLFLVPPVRPRLPHYTFSHRKRG